MYRERAGTIRVGGSTNPQKRHYADSKGNLMLNITVLITILRKLHNLHY